MGSSKVRLSCDEAIIAYNTLQSQGRGVLCLLATVSYIRHNSCDTFPVASYLISAGESWDAPGAGMTGVNSSKETRGTREIFAELYEEFLPRVFRYIRYRVNSEQVTEDLTSIVFEKALTNFERYSKEKASFSTWIFSIAHNVVIDYYRTQARRPTFSLEKAEIEVSSNEPLPVDTLENMEEREKLRACILRLPSEEQEIIALKFGSGLNNRQIARTMGLSESNVGTRLYRAVRKLRDSFREADNG